MSLNLLFIFIIPSAIDALGKPKEEQRNDTSVEMGLLKSEEEQCDDSSVETGLRNDLRKVSLQEFREELKRVLESVSTVQGVLELLGIFHINGLQKAKQVRKCCWKINSVPKNNSLLQDNSNV
ncbi:hypothetical protein MHYP_G00088650 [Metynnis hypsauchen]